MIDVAAMTDTRMLELIDQARQYTVCVLRPGPQWGVGDWEKVIWEHGRRNLALREAGRLVVTLRVPSDSIVGIGVYDDDLGSTRAVLDGDPAVRAEILRYELFCSDGFPGDALPEAG